MAYSILQIHRYIENLSEKDKKRFLRMYHVNISTGKIIIPISMIELVKKNFGSVKSVENQKIIKITNKISCESVLFNELRAKRPVDIVANDELLEIIKKSENGAFCNAEDQTPEDIFGRIRGKHSITAANIAKYDEFHSLVILKIIIP